MMKKLLPVLALALMLCGCGETEKSRYCEEKMILQSEGVYTMYDGCRVDLWTMGMMNQDYYCIEDKDGDLQDILVVDAPAGPQGIKNDGLCFDDLNETAKAVIGAYYEEQGILYDITFELEDAYAEYIRCENHDRTYNDHYISQRIWPTGATDKIIAFCTELISYRGEKNARQDWYNVIFDRETGEQIGIETLFVVSEDQAKALILDALMPEELEWEEKDLRQQMEEAFSFDYIKLLNDGIEVMFPVGTLECKEEAFGGFIPTEELTGIMQPWALNP